MAIQPARDENYVVRPIQGYVPDHPLDESQPLPFNSARPRVGGLLLLSSGSPFKVRFFEMLGPSPVIARVCKSFERAVRMDAAAWNVWVGAPRFLPNP